MKFRRSLFVATLLFAAATAWQSASAQSNAQSNAKSAASSADAAAGIRSYDSADRSAENKDAAGKENSEDDGTAQFKQSSSVQWLRKQLGPPAGAPYWVAVATAFSL